MTVGLRIHVEPLPEGMWADGSRACAFEEMYRRCYPQLVDLCRRQLCGRGDPEAVAQEAFIRAWSSLDKFSGARPFWPWVATIARRLCIDHRRRLERENSNLHVAAAATDSEMTSPDELLETGEEYRAAVRALRTLKPSEQRVIALREVNGWSYDEIARFEGVTVESIRGSLKRARASLRRSYAKVASSAPAAFAGHRLRARVVRWSGARGSHATMSLAIGGDLAAGLVALTLAVAGAPASSPPTRSVAIQSAKTAMVLVSAVAPDAGRSLDRAVNDTQARQGGGTPASPSRNADQRQDDWQEAPQSPLVIDGVDTVDEAVFTDFASSPSYEGDGTVFAVGSGKHGCPAAHCPVLFKSTDRGGTWRRLPGVGFPGGSVLLPPDYPHDRRIFVAGPTSLLVSTDDGTSFQPIAPIGGPAAVSPGFAADRRIVMGQAPGWEYRDDVGAMRPSGMVIPTTSVATTPIFSPDYLSDGRLFVGGTTVDDNGRQQSAVFRCTKSLCSDRALLPDVIGAPLLAIAPPSFEGDVVLAWRGDRLFRSLDGGGSFRQTTLPVSGVVRGATFADDGRMVVGTLSVNGDGTGGGVVASSDGGESWSRLGEGTALDRGVHAVVALPDRIFAGVSLTAGGGLLCSVDGGVTWEATCGAH